MVKDMEINKVYDLDEVLKVRKRRPLWQIRLEHQVKIDNIKSKRMLDKYTSKYGYKEYDLAKCNVDNMPEFIYVYKNEYDEEAMERLIKNGVVHCIWDKGDYNCRGSWNQTFICRHKDYKRICRELNIEPYTWEYEENKGVSRDDWGKWSVVCGVHDGLWDNIGDLVEDKSYARNSYKRDAVVRIVVNYIVENMDRFINYFFRYSEVEAMERMYFDSKKELGIK